MSLVCCRCLYISWGKDRHSAGGLENDVEEEEEEKEVGEKSGNR